MQISVIDREQSLTAETQELAERRLLFALSRFDSRVEHIELVIADAEGARGGVAKACRVLIRLRRLPELRVASVGADVETTIAHAADRAGRAVARAIERCNQRLGRSRMPAW